MQISATHYAAAADADAVAGAGATLQRVVVNNDGFTVTLSDSATHGAGQTIAVIGSSAIGTFDYGIPLTNGLSLEITGTGGDITVVTSTTAAGPVSTVAS